MSGWSARAWTAASSTSRATAKSPPRSSSCTSAARSARIRYASYKQDWGGYYEAGGLLIADRYTTSNAVHQASKLPDGEREKFLDWLFGFEYGLLGLPEPSLVFYLDVPTEVTERLMRERERATHTAADIHEADDAYLRECRENARGVAARCGWQRVDCTRDGRMRGIEDIHEEVYARVKALLG